MIYDIPKPYISPMFTVEDIHKIRAWDYERLKDATHKERRDDTELRAERTRRTIEELRRINELPQRCHCEAGPAEEVAEVTELPYETVAGLI